MNSNYFSNKMLFKPIQVFKVHNLFLISFLIHFRTANAQGVETFLSFKNMNSDPDFGVTTLKLITNKGFEGEKHLVKTEDDYVLSMFRILPKCRFCLNNPILFLQHGLLGSSSDWVLLFENSSLGFLSHLRGYDVWLGNFRGNTYSRKHAKFSTKNPEFWNFSWDEMALHDLPAMIDYVLNVTGQRKLYYCGHSMGTTTLFALLSEKPQYQDKIIAAATLAPVATIAFSTNPVFQLFPYKFFIEEASALLGTRGEILTNTAQYKALINILCGLKLITNICTILVPMILSEGPYANRSRLAVYLSHFPAGTSINTIVHYAQGHYFAGSVFQKFDYGFIENLGNYQQLTPPQYEIGRITVPICLFSSTGDNLSNQKDIDFLRKNLKNINRDEVIRDFKFSHLDFIIAENAHKLVYEGVFECFRSNI